jgi:hypothetical protein
MTMELPSRGHPTASTMVTERNPTIGAVKLAPIMGHPKDKY